jgi:D-alanyl-D-alanine dipeptidase
MHNIGETYMELEMCETENPPILIDDDPKNVFKNYGKIENYLMRKKIYDMLVEAKERLPKNVFFYAFEIYRPMQKQIEYWESTLADFKKQFPQDAEEEIIRKVEIYIANPYKEGSGHQTGAAIDITLCDENGKLFDMGTEWRENISKTMTFSNELTLQQQENRNTLMSAMVRSGFTNYFEEWWHFCYGELEWAVMTRIGKTKFLKLKI